MLGKHWRRWTFDQLRQAQESPAETIVQDKLLTIVQIPASERRGIAHHLLDILDPTEDFNAGVFYEQARAATEQILQVGFPRFSCLGSSCKGGAS